MLLSFTTVSYAVTPVSQVDISKIDPARVGERFMPVEKPPAEAKIIIYEKKANKKKVKDKPIKFHLNKIKIKGAS